MSEVATLRYRAFISYSHRDQSIVQALHRSLETFSVPAELAGKDSPYGKVPAKLSPIFLDRSDLEAGSSLSDKIRAALTASEAMVVVCSPDAARSRHVEEEIRLFKAMGRGNRVYALIVAGEPDGPTDNCFPPALLAEFDGDGRPTGRRVEPIAADWRGEGDGPSEARLKLVAGLLGVKLDDLRRREAAEQARQKRFWRRVSIAMAGLAVLAAASTVFAYQQSSRNAKLLDKSLQYASKLTEKAIEQTGEFGVPLKVGVEFLEEAKQIFDELDKAGASDDQLAKRRGQMHLSFADSYLRLGRLSDQATAAEAALTLAQRIISHAPRDMEALRLKADALVHRGKGHEARRELKQALDLFQQSLDIRLANFGGDTSSEPIQLRGLAHVYGAIARAHYKRGAHRDSLKFKEKVLAYTTRLDAAVGDLDTRFLRTQALMVLSDSDRVLGNNERALKSVAEGLGVADNVLKTSTKLAWFRLRASFLVIKGDIERKQKMFKEALESYAASLAQRNRLSDADPQNISIRSEVAYSRIKLAETHILMQDMASAVEHAEAAASIYEQVLKRNPENQGIARQLIDALHSVSLIHRRNGKRAELRDSNERKLQIARRQLELDPENRDSKRMLSEAYSALGDTEMLDGKPEAALVYFEISEGLLRPLAEGADTGKHEHAEVLELIAHARLRLGDADGASKAVGEAREIRVGLLATIESDQARRQRLAENLRLLAKVGMAKSDCAAAIASIETARELQERVVKEGPLLGSSGNLEAIESDDAAIRSKCAPPPQAAPAEPPTMNEASR